MSDKPDDIDKEVGELLAARAGRKPIPKAFNRTKGIDKTYDEMKDLDGEVQLCPVCGEQGNKGRMERHHIAGRNGTNLLRYIYLHPGCHHNVHYDPDWATKQSLLWPGRNTKEITSPEWGEILKKLGVQ